MKKILFGTLAAATLLGFVSGASAQLLSRDADEFGYASGPGYGGPGYQSNVYGWVTAPYDPNSGASIGYNRNIADPNSVGGASGAQ